MDRAYSFDTYLWYDEITDFNPNSDEDALNTELRAKGILESRFEDWAETRKYFELMKTFEVTSANNPKIDFTSLTIRRNGNVLLSLVSRRGTGWSTSELVTADPDNGSLLIRAKYAGF